MWRERSFVNAPTENNIFRLSAPADYLCTVSVYSAGRSDMYIRAAHVSRAEDRFHLVFRRVVYFSGMMHWRSADFQRASREEFLDFVQNMEALSLSPNDEGLHLYVVDHHYPPTYIIATDAEKLDQVGAIITAAEQ